MQTASANSPLRSGPRQAARRTGSTQRPQPPVTGGTAAHGFLSHGFAPKYKPSAQLPERVSCERDFFRSLSRLKKHYGIHTAGFRRLPYPYNVLVAMGQVSRVVRTGNRIREVFITEQDDHSVCLSVREFFRQDYNLYYIPVVPLCKLWRKKREMQTAALLTAVCAYLYRQAGLSYYRDEGTYMYYNYETLRDWTEEAGEEDQRTYKAHTKNINEAEMAGDFILGKMMDSCSPERLEELTHVFRPRTAYQQEALALACTARQLMQTFPDGDLFRHAGPANEDEDDDDCNNTVYMQESIGFVGSTTDALSESLLSMIENDFNERMCCQEPELMKHFNRDLPACTDELAYEESALRLIASLCFLLLKKP